MRSFYALANRGVQNPKPVKRRKKMRRVKSKRMATAKKAKARKKPVPRRRKLAAVKLKPKRRAKRVSLKRRKHKSVAVKSATRRTLRRKAKPAKARRVRHSLSVSPLQRGSKMARRKARRRNPPLAGPSARAVKVRASKRNYRKARHGGELMSAYTRARRGTAKGLGAPSHVGLLTAAARAERARRLAALAASIPYKAKRRKKAAAKALARKRRGRPAGVKMTGAKLGAAKSRAAKARAHRSFLRQIGGHPFRGEHRVHGPRPQRAKKNPRHRRSRRRNPTVLGFNFEFRELLFLGAGLLGSGVIARSLLKLLPLPATLKTGAVGRLVEGLGRVAVGAGSAIALQKFAKLSSADARSVFLGSALSGAYTVAAGSLPFLGLGETQYMLGETQYTLGYNFGQSLPTQLSETVYDLKAPGTPGLSGFDYGSTLPSHLGAYAELPYTLGGPFAQLPY